MTVKHSILVPSIIALASYGQPPMQLEQYDPSIGYIYPAGAQRGTVTTVTVGGQYMQNADRAFISGDGVRARVVGYDRPISNREALQMGNKIKEVRRELGLKEGAPPNWEQMRVFRQKTGMTRELRLKLEDFANIRRDPRFQGNPQIAEELTVELTVDSDAKPGRRELRILRDGRISAPLAFCIGDYPEHTEADGKTIKHLLPAVVNGQIMPGEKDCYAFKASKGDQLVVACTARELIPHLADAVPGWFQAVLTLYDAEGHELAYADDYRFHPDPVLCHDIPADGIYTLEIKDALSRGRQDFVYRITLGEIPFVTSIFPLGGKVGEKTAVTLRGRNLPAEKGKVGTQDTLRSIKGIPLACPVPFAHGDQPELFESEPNSTESTAMPIRSTCTINGRINEPGDRDVFAIKLTEGRTLVAEVTARRLGSPLDSVLKVTDSTGRHLAINNDCEDKSLGRMTHHADSRLVLTAPQSGIYYVHLGDLQNGGGPDHAYRLQLGTPKPDYSLRAAPSSLNGVPGGSVHLTVYALRKDGFDGEIKLALKNDIAGLRLDGARIPEGQDKVELTVTLPEEPLTGPASLVVEGLAEIEGKSVRRLAVPSEDMMQAFIYHHLVPAEDVFLSNIENRYPSRQQAECAENGPLQLRRGETTKLLFHASTWFGRSQRGYELEPCSFPDGVSIKKVLAEDGVIEVTLSTDASAERGLEGNLVLNQAVEHRMRGKNQDGVRGTLRISAGPLPAVPFKIR